LSSRDIVGKIDSIKRSIAEAFQSGKIDFDAIESELESLKSQIEASPEISDQSLKIEDFK